MQREHHQVPHARIALQVNTAGMCPPLLFALRLLLQLICWSCRSCICYCWLTFSSVCAFWCASRYLVLLSSKLLTHLCYAWYMYMTEPISLWNASILDCMSVCILTLCVILLLLLALEHQHARIALQVNTAGTCPPLLFALRLLLQLICWSCRCC